MTPTPKLKLRTKLTVRVRASRSSVQRTGFPKVGLGGESRVPWAIMPKCYRSLLVTRASLAAAAAAAVAVAEGWAEGWAACLDRNSASNVAGSTRVAVAVQVAAAVVAVVAAVAAVAAVVAVAVVAVVAVVTMGVVEVVEVVEVALRSVGVTTTRECSLLSMRLFAKAPSCLTSWTTQTSSVSTWHVQQLRKHASVGWQS